MLTVDEDYIPVLNCNIEILNFTDEKFLLCLDHGKKSKFIIGEEIKNLISLIGQNRSIKQITYLYNKEYKSEFLVETIVLIFNNNLLGLGILNGDSDERILIKDNYLSLRFTFLNEDYVKFFSTPLSILFSKKTNLFLFLISIGILVFFYIRDINFSELYFGFSSVFGLWFIAIYIISHVFHELGHAAACIRYKACPGKIGIGFYFFRPVFFADVSDVWRLNRIERIIVDLAGIYMQILFCAFFVVIYFFTENRFFLNMSFLVSSTLLFHLNPFFRYDGYWVLTDVLNITNLRERSIASTKLFFKMIFLSDTTWKPTKLNLFFIIYTLFSFFFLLYFFCVVLIYKRDIVMFFPIDLYFFFVDIISNAEHVNFDWLKWKLLSFIIPISFYTMLYFFIKKWFIRFARAKEIRV